MKFETINHALWGCKRAKAICDSIFSRIDGNIVVNNNFSDRIVFLVGNLSVNEFEKACIAFWSIWNNHNDFREGKPIADWHHQCE